MHLTKLYVETLYNNEWTLMAQSCCEAVLQEPKNVMGLLAQDFATCQSVSSVLEASFTDRFLCPKASSVRLIFLNLGIHLYKNLCPKASVSLLSSIFWASIRLAYIILSLLLWIGNARS